MPALKLVNLYVREIGRPLTPEEERLLHIAEMYIDMDESEEDSAMDDTPKRRESA